MLTIVIALFVHRWFICWFNWISFIVPILISTILINTIFKALNIWWHISEFIQTHVSWNFAFVILRKNSFFWHLIRSHYNIWLQTWHLTLIFQTGLACYIRLHVFYRRIQISLFLRLLKLIWFDIFYRLSPTIYNLSISKMHFLIVLAHKPMWSRLEVVYNIFCIFFYKRCMFGII